MHTPSSKGDATPCAEAIPASATDTTNARHAPILLISLLSRVLSARRRTATRVPPRTRAKRVSLRLRDSPERVAPAARGLDGSYVAGATCGLSDRFELHRHAGHERLARERLEAPGARRQQRVRVHSRRARGDAQAGAA